ncbi:MAG: SCP2 sterol-binding domain-containing protein [Ktedonobacteraceae bacterium]|nr:SCP2 sterol-binding domain-containing protein [Ktedonobacteraceae bacterium]
MNVDETFEMMKRLFNPLAAVGFNKTIQWDIQGVETGKWALKIVNQTCQLIKGEVDKAHLIMSMSDQTWLSIAEGKLDPINAFTTGKVKMSGDITLVMHLQDLFPIKGRFFGE